MGPISTIDIGGITNVNPLDFPDEVFEYYSIPAYQEGRKPALVRGKEILSQKLLIPPQCVLFGKLNPRVQKVWNVRQTLRRRGAASTEWLPVVPKPDIDQDFVYFLLLSEWVMPVAQSLVSGSTPSRQRVEPAAFYQIRVPVPPLYEQQQIARILRLIEISLETQRQQLALLQRLKHAAMRTLFTRGLRGEAQKETEIGLLPEGWSVVTLGSLGRIGNGSTPKKSVAAYWKAASYPWLTSAKVYDRTIIEADDFVSEAALAECHLPRLFPGSVLMAITGQGKTLGHCAVLAVEATINQHLAYIAVDRSLAIPEFVRDYLETQYEYLRQVGAGGGSTKGALTCGFLRGMNMPLPSLEEQHEIVAILDAIDRKVGLHRRKRALLEELFKTLLHELMTGEIRVAELDLSALSPPMYVEAAHEPARTPPLDIRTA